jgi:hypothetical protein
MKKLTAMILAVMAIACFAGCNSETGGKSGAKLEDKGDGTLTYLETENSPLDGGLLITVDKNAGTVNMQITDKSGNETTEYYKFSPADTTCERYRYVAMMGTGFYYTYDYDAGEITKILDNDKEDTTESTKEAGRFESAQSETKEQVDSLISYFETTFGTTLGGAIE